MNRIEISFYIARTPDDVFAFLTDFSQLTRRRQLDSLRLDPDGTFPIQSGWRVESRDGG